MVPTPSFLQNQQKPNGKDNLDQQIQTPAVTGIKLAASRSAVGGQSDNLPSRLNVPEAVLELRIYSADLMTVNESG